ncbi:hypothetical protein QQ045_033277 [Rhodiola kirilowii]
MLLCCCRSVRISISLLPCCSESLDRLSPQTKNSVGRWSCLEPRWSVRSNDDRAFGYEGVDGATSCSISQESSGRRPMNDMNTNVGLSPVAADLSFPTRFGKRSIASTGMYHTQSRSQQDKGRWNGNSNKSRLPQMMKPFDICESSLVASSISQSKESWVKKFVTDVPREILRPGMVLLKNFLSLDDQVKIVRMCRELGLGEGGFYQPGFDDGRKLRLQMMCLGLDWDPQTNKYGETRRLDGARPPAVPENFTSITEKAIEAAHNLIKTDISAGNVADILPLMRPNICIVNFYNTSGRLGLHQDKDESRESLEKRLPVVSISLGDAAEFLYGDQRDVDKAEKVALESGDVLIFGGSSRHIFHGVASVIPDSAPAAFQQASKLRSGRLNLTFREF